MRLAVSWRRGVCACAHALVLVRQRRVDHGQLLGYVLLAHHVILARRIAPATAALARADRADEDADDDDHQTADDDTDQNQPLIW